MFQKRNLCFPNHIDLMLGVVERFDVLCSETPFRPLNIKLGPLSNKLFIEVSFFNGPKTVINYLQLTRTHLEGSITIKALSTSHDSINSFSFVLFNFYPNHPFLRV